MSRQVEQSLAAALADPARAGRDERAATAPVESAGFGFELPADAVAVPSLVLVRGGRAGDAPGNGRATQPDADSRPGAAPPASTPRPRKESTSLADARTSKAREREEQGRAQRAADERAEQERAEQRRAEQERAEQERAEQERAEQERVRAEAVAALDAARAAEDDAQHEAQAAADDVAGLRSQVAALDEEAEQLRAASRRSRRSAPWWPRPSRPRTSAGPRPRRRSPPPAAALGRRSGR